MRTLWLCFTAGALLPVAFTACSDANDSTDGGSLQTPYDAGRDSGLPGHDASVTMVTPDAGQTVTKDTGSGTGSAPLADAATAGVVINEVNGKESDYVELFNAGSTAVSLGSWGVSEAKHDDAGVPGTPKSAVIFPAGTMLAAGAYALVLGAPKDGGTVISPCPASVCVQATWNVSNSSGSTVYLLNSAMVMVATAALPGGDTGDGQSWGRLPNGSGTFQLNTQTPGATNTSP